MSKPIYKPNKPYQEDINDLVEKGGVGSGIRGHVTPTIKDYHKENQLKEALKTGRLDQLRGLNSYYTSRVKESKGTKYEKYYREKANQVASALMNRLKNG